MARKVSVELTDDLDGSTGNITTIEFGIDGKTYEIDLSDTNAAKLRGDLAKWVAVARTKTRHVHTRRARTPGGKLTDDGIRLEDVRVWASANGHTVSSRGRVPAAIIDAYRAKAPVQVAAAKVEKALTAAKDKLAAQSLPEFLEAGK